ncbi:Glutathione-dependent formaldehyde-activating, GFA [Penicillium digitatum]|uniref:CENP-V/GFA domain-containing protein n=3 Tax=Penicillium digitatum TaxID=36651 RepID=K9G5N6_PEND2|nr:hypothetical protein PDIP_67920 [Penicillium digitatum Pd1]EKV08500.1 hypothetical protein PDIP_67920 [Penicillium digitatum Pd1]EKV10153.1 hypothetical protein PDIG_58440 [Penicillium digitatum PHI26]QQK41783.1 Glutathione-dependent formaldehyde-activating, GFA [Penicillium digitatum]
MAVGGCFCGKVRVEYKGQPLASGLCHCYDCRKLTGAPYSYSFIVKNKDLEISGSPKEVAKRSEGETRIKNYFCPDCGTPLFGRKIKANGDPDEITIIRAGIFDDSRILNERTPVAEMYIEQRLKWISPIEGADQFCGMLPLP